MLKSRSAEWNAQSIEKQPNAEDDGCDCARRAGIKPKPSLLQRKKYRCSIHRETISSYMLSARGQAGAADVVIIRLYRVES